MAKYERSKKTKSFKDLESPHRNESYEDRTGEKFERQINYQLVDIGGGYVTRECKTDKNHSSN